ncbi:MAG: hypothetical protein ACERKD_08420 [Prolixibacteraceae bacterium]
MGSSFIGFMDGKIEESMTSTIHVVLTDKRNKKVLVNENGCNGSQELAGNISFIQVNH